HHLVQDAVAPAESPLGITGYGGIVARALDDACEQGCLVRVIDRVDRERLAEIVFRRRREAVAPVAHVEKARIPGEDLLLRLAPRTEAALQLFLQPEGQPDLLHLS